MKALSTFCLLLATGLTALAQPTGAIALEDTQFNAQFAKQTIPKVTGRLLHLSPQELAKTTITYTLVTLTGQIKKTTSANPDGRFRLELDYPLPYQQIWLQVGELFYAGLYANTQLHLELDAPKLKATAKEVNFYGEGVRYLGEDGPLNTYMNEYVLYRRPEQQALRSRINRIPFQKPVATEVMAAYGPLFDSLKIIQDEYIATHPSPYGWLLENERLSELYGQLCLAYWYRSMDDRLFKPIKAHKTYLISNSSTGYYRYLATYLRSQPSGANRVTWQQVALRPDLNAIEKAAIDSLRATATHVPVRPLRDTWFKQLQPKMQQMIHDQLVGRGIQVLDSLFAPSKADLLKLWLNQSEDIAEQKSALELIVSSMHTSWCRRVAQTDYEHVVAKVAAANRALAQGANSLTAADFGPPLQQTDFGATLYTISKMSGADFLARLRRSLAGKAIVYDHWATWCGPCLGEMPHSKQLQQASKDLPVVFVYVCTAQGSNKEKWQRKIGELELPGLHFFVDEALDAALSQYFSFSGYPGYAFIDQKGVYKPGAITRVSMIKDKQALATLLD